MYTQKEVSDLEKEWKTDNRWKGILRPYSAESVVKFRGSLKIDYTLAKVGAEKLRKLFETAPFVRAMGALTGNQAVQQVQAGLKAIYVSGWQVAADANDAAQTYPDQSLYPYLSVPHLITRIYNALSRADQIQHLQNGGSVDWFVPLVVDAEAGFGGALNTYETIRAMIIAGAAGVHLEDQISSLKKCGHMGGKVLETVPVMIEKLIAARLAADVLGIPTVIIARTDAESASYLRSDSDQIDKEYLTGERTYDGFFHIRGGIDYSIARGRAYAPYSDMIWCETSKPDLGEAREFAQGIHEKFPGKWLAYNCSPSFNWKRNLDDNTLKDFQEKLGEMGYKFQFITLAGFHSLNAGMYELAYNYANKGVAAYANFQCHEFELEKTGFKAIKHQSFVGAGYYDELLLAVTKGLATSFAMKGSTEESQF